LGFWAALGFLTIIPSPVRRSLSLDEVGRALPFFPLVGLLLGLVLWLFDTVLSRVLPAMPVNVLLVGVLVVLTGAMHVDGFIDTCDGAATGRTSEQRLAIMKDSRVGAFGVIGGCLLLLLKFVALSSLPLSVRPFALVLMPAMGRWSMVFAVYSFPYARGEAGKGYAFKRGAKSNRMLIATLSALAIALVVVSWKRGPILLATVLLTAFLLCTYIRSRLGGLTGDSYGATNEAVEVVTVLALPIIWRIA